MFRLCLRCIINVISESFNVVLLTKHGNVKPGAIVALVRDTVREDHFALVPAVVAFAYRGQIEGCFAVEYIVVEERHTSNEGFVSVQHAIV